MPANVELSRQPNPRLAAIILCGGKSSRMGRDKASLCLGNETLLQRVCRQTGEVAGRVVVVAAPGQFIDLTLKGIDVVVDDSPGAGPLAGFLTGLRFLTELSDVPSSVCLVACDTPFVSAEIIETIDSQLLDFDAVVVEHQERLNPLIAVYRTAIHSQVAACFEAGERSPTKFLQQLNFRRLPSHDVSESSHWLLNINTPNDLTQAQAICQTTPPF